MALRGRKRVLGDLMYWRMYRHELSVQIGDGGEDAKSDDVALDLGEPQFDLVEPGRVSRREVQPDTIKRWAMGKMRALAIHRRKARPHHPSARPRADRRRGAPLNGAIGLEMTWRRRAFSCAREAPRGF